VNVSDDKQSYRENAPFSTVSYIGGPFQVFLKGNEIYYDERLPLKEDYDMTLQQLNKYRVVLRANKFFYSVKQSEQAGGCATYRNLEREKKQLEMLQKKWGKKIVRIDNNNRSHNLKKEKTKIDYNPIIKPPIKGI
jgi:sensor c-di-GMP phosphodiesterase-like protein